MSLSVGSDAAIQILPKGCMCGHDHRTHRGEEVHLCLECSCEDKQVRCQNCGGEVPYTGQPEARFDGRYYDVCSSRCRTQLEYARSRTEEVI